MIFFEVGQLMSIPDSGPQAVVVEHQIQEVLHTESNHLVADLRGIFHLNPVDVILDEKLHEKCHDVYNQNNVQ